MNEPNNQRGQGLAERFRRAVAWGNTLWTVIGWFGWKQLVISVAIAVAGWTGGYLRDEPIVTLSMSAVSLFVALAYLFRLPRIAMLMSSKPNVGIWRHVEALTLSQAACLFAEVSPTAMGNWFPTPDADAYYSALAQAAGNGELERTLPPGRTGGSPVGMPESINFGTFVTRSSLRKFASKRNFNPRFLQ